VRAARRRGVAAIEKRVDENVANARVLGDFHQRVEMFDVRMDTAVGKQAPEMERAVFRSKIGEKCFQRRIRRQRPSAIALLIRVNSW